jgi:hypothetical protein
MHHDLDQLVQLDQLVKLDQLDQLVPCRRMHKSNA